MPSQVDAFLKPRLATGATFTAAEIEKETGLTRQAVVNQLRRMVARGELVRLGGGRSTRYRSADAAQVPELSERRYRIAGLAEDEVWSADIAKDPLLAGVHPNALGIFRYAFTEILNNAIDHSEAPRVDVIIERTQARVAFEIADEGVGIFEKIRRAYALTDPRDAIVELSKGKVTTDPRRHTGQGIFFVSKAAELFQIVSAGLTWLVDNVRDDTAVGGSGGHLARGTRVRFEIERGKAVTLEQLFEPYTTDLEFDTTRILVKLVAMGTTFVSRSEAKRLTAGLEKFRVVILDFNGVESVGQGFVDEIFRVWASDHPEVEIRPVNMNRGIEFMIRRGVSAETPNAER